MNQPTSFIVSSSPHLRAAENTTDIMRWVCIALMPAFGVALYAFGWRALFVAAVTVLACVITEYFCQKWRGTKITIGDFSAVLSGLLLAATLPPNVAWWIPIIGGVFAIAVVKQAFGGLGSNIWNPALAARALLQVSFPTQINSPTWVYINNDNLTFMERCWIWLDGGFQSYTANTSPDIISSATALTALKSVATNIATTPQTIQELLNADKLNNYWQMIVASFWGVEGGCIAEGSAIALLLGGLFLIAKKIIGWETPFFYLATVALLCWALPAPYYSAGIKVYTEWFCGPVLLQLIGGGLLLGAFFMTTDYVTTPLTKKGKIIFAVGCGIITALIRLYSNSYPEGCCYSILIMNTCVPLIDAWTRPKKYGEVKT